MSWLLKWPPSAGQLLVGWVVLALATGIPCGRVARRARRNLEEEERRRRDPDARRRPPRR